MALRIKRTELCEENYLPGEDVLRLLLGTKKHTYVVGKQLDCPGLIDYNDNPWPTLWFSVAVILEAFGLWVLFQAGLVWFAAAALFFIDIALAFVRHLPVGKIRHQKNVLVLTEPGTTSDHIRNKIRKYRILTWIVSLGIVAIALVKILGFYAFVGEINPMTLFIIVTYIVVAIIHLTFTGYFIWWFAVEWRDWLGHRKYRQALTDWQLDHRDGTGAPCIGAPHEIPGVGRSTPITIPDLKVPGYVVNRHLLINNDLLDSTGNLPDKLFQDFGPEAGKVRPTLQCTGFINHYLTQKSNEVKNDTYTLFSWGLLTDDQLRGFCNMIPSNNDQRAMLARHLLEHQLLNILSVSMGLKSTEGGKHGTII